MELNEGVSEGEALRDGASLGSLEGDTLGLDDSLGNALGPLEGANVGI
jgi:hypothetical protein